jgi:lysophospholipid acyltransferase (LPLAT)-like uncharacterized protein
MLLRVFWRLAEWPIGLGWYVYASLVRLTSAVIVSGAPPDGPVIFVNWHRYQAFLIPHHGAHRRWMLVSPATPLAPVARFSLLCGLNLVRGASGDRGKQALEELAQVLSAGHSITLAVDGPAGPRFRAKRGCADLAIRTGFPVVPVRYQSIRGRTLEWRWDRTLLPVPFDRIVVQYGAPVTSSGSAEQLLGVVQKGLTDLEAA